jgi:predicted type IV restriction endonuclease
MEIAERISVLGKNLSDRIDPEFINFALTYIEHNEIEIALDTLFEFLIEHEIEISENEAKEVISLGKFLGISNGDIALIKNLVKKNKQNSKGS